MKVTRHAILVAIFAGLAVVAVTALVIVTIIGNQDTAKFSSYQECVQSDGAVILESYPEQCQARNGQVFTNPDQVAPTP